MDFGKKFSENFKGAFSRVTQYTQEVLGTGDKTEFDKSFEDLIEKYEKTRMWTERILEKVEHVLQPSPNTKAEDFLIEKVDKKRQTAFELLSQEFIEAGSDFGGNQPYGYALLKTGKAFQNIARAEREYVRTVLIEYVQPLRNFLENDYKAVTKERKVLETKRLDLDACKGKLKKVKTAETQAQAEQELRVAQSEFDRQIEITKLLLDGIYTTHAIHLRCLRNFAEFHSQYYSHCHQYMAELQRELDGQEESSADVAQWKTVKELSAERITELSVRVNEVVHGLSTIGKDSQWLLKGRESSSSSIHEIKPAE